MQSDLLGQPEAWLALFVLTTLLLGWTITSLIRTLRDSLVATLSMRAEQIFTLLQAGTYDLYVECIRFNTDFRNIEFALLVSL